MKRKEIIILVTVFVIVILLTPCPIPIEIKDGGTKVYYAILYKVIKWNAFGLGPNGGTKVGTQIVFFPFNFMN